MGRWRAGSAGGGADRARGKRQRRTHRHDDWCARAWAPDPSSGWAMTGRWELLEARPGGTVTSLVTSGSVVLAATPAGLRRSTDDGRTWSVVGRVGVPSSEVVVASPAFTADALLLAGTADGLLRSQDAGQTWQ